MTWRQPPPGWHAFGTHLDHSGLLEFSAEVGEDGLPEFERLTNHDPAVDIWAEALATLRQGRHPAPRPDRRTPFEVSRDERLEDIAEERAARNRGDYATDQEADEAADRYYRDR